MTMPRTPRTVHPSACRAGVLKKDWSHAIAGQCNRRSRFGRERKVKTRPAEARDQSQWSMGFGLSLAKGSGTRRPVFADS